MNNWPDKLGHWNEFDNVTTFYHSCQKLNIASQYCNNMDDHCNYLDLHLKSDVVFANNHTIRVLMLVSFSHIIHKAYCEAIL